MIKVLGKGARLAPVIVCDVCEKRIEDVQLAGVVMSNPFDLPDNQMADCLHVHKGQCFNTAEAKLGGPGEAGFYELRLHLVELLYGLGIDEKGFAGIVEQKREMDSIF